MFFIKDKVLNIKLAFCWLVQAINNTARQLIVISLTRVFKDIIPGSLTSWYLLPHWHSYRVRPLTEKEKSASVSKEVALIRKFEQGLLGFYQRFLDSLHKQLKSYTRTFANAQSSASRHIKVLGTLAAKSLCELLESCFHFNYRSNLVSVLTPLMTGLYGTEVRREAIYSFHLRKLCLLSVKAAKAVIIEDHSFDATCGKLLFVYSHSLQIGYCSEHL